MRGIAYSLGSWSGTEWRTEFYISALAEGRSNKGAPAWWLVDDRDRGWIDIGIGGEGPDIAVVPDPAGSGTYRICTANSPESSCALLDVK